MKLFQRLLVAPAALGLLAPISANANEVNLNEISYYSDIESIEFANSFKNDDSSVNPLLAGGEGLVDSHSHDGGFSETTTASVFAFPSTAPIAISTEKLADVVDEKESSEP